jgi:hypothetical protein
MTSGKSSISNAQSYRAIGEFWDAHDLADYWDQIQPVDLELDVQDEVTYYPVDLTLSAELRTIARQRGVSPETLLNLWVQEMVQETAQEEPV